MFGSMKDDTPLSSVSISGLAPWLTVRQ